jgi:DNA-binding FrmR family transcriptional regulator
VSTSLPGYHDNKDDVLRRLKRIEGQVRGLERMVEADTYCIDVMTQIAATTKALQAVATRLLDEHLHHCVAGAAADHADPASLAAEATKAVERLLRT